MNISKTIEREALSLTEEGETVEQTLAHALRLLKEHATLQKNILQGTEELDAGEGIDGPSFMADLKLQL